MNIKYKEDKLNYTINLLLRREVCGLIVEYMKLNKTLEKRP